MKTKRLDVMLIVNKCCCCDCCDCCKKYN